MKQLPLQLGHGTALGAEDFLESPANAEALAWLARWPDWPGRALAIHGPPGCGKTHLASIFAAGAQATVVRGGDLAGLDPVSLAEVPAVVVDDADSADEEALFHLLNATKGRGAGLLLCARQAPARWPVRLADLRSRLAAIAAVGIGEPDEALLAAVMVKLFADRQLIVGQEVITYLLGRMERSLAAVLRTVEALDRASLADRRAVTVALARRVLGET